MSGFERRRARDESADRALDVLRHHGRSFHFAGRLLSARDLRRSARLYAFCRWLDDLVDEGHPTLARRQLCRVRSDLELKRASSRRVDDFLELAEESRIPLCASIDLIDGLEQDLARVRVSDWDELVCYAYRVAGTVGLMMSHVLDAKTPDAQAFAIDLGIAMQLTNVVRDVGEDAAMGRRYLPASWVGELEPQALAQHPLRVGDACRRLVSRAEDYYHSGLSGLGFLPIRSGLAIGVAARVYRRIGRRLVEQGANPLTRRTVVPLWQKLLLTPPSLMDDLLPGARPQHDSRLHAPLVAFRNLDALSQRTARNPNRYRASAYE